MSSETSVNKSARVAALMLSLFALSGAALVAGTHHVTEPVIADNERQQMLAQLDAVLSGIEYDNDLLAQPRWLARADITGSEQSQPVYLARAGGAVQAAVFVVMAPDGYAGPIKLLVGIDHRGAVRGVRVIAHRETPGLGDGIETQRSDWIHQFAGHSLRSTGKRRWRVNKDGGVFDSLTGATVTSRAVVRAVRRLVVYVAGDGSSLFSPKAVAGEGI